MYFFLLENDFCCIKMNLFMLIIYKLLDFVSHESKTFCENWVSWPKSIFVVKGNIISFVVLSLI